jgi:DNA-directed RNA polymerase specialized sigma24 family protein
VRALKSFAPLQPESHNFLETLFDSGHVARKVAHLQRIGLSEEQAHDAVQDAMLELASKLDWCNVIGVRPATMLSGFASRRMLDQWADYKREPARFGLMSDLDSLPEMLADASFEDDSVNTIHRARVVQELTAVIGTFPTAEREALRASLVADELDNTAKARTARSKGVKRLRKRLLTT